MVSSAAIKSDDDDDDVGDVEAKTASSSSEMVSYTLTLEDFLEQSQVKAYIHSQNVDPTDVEALLEYLPKTVEIDAFPDRVRGRIGDAAQEGYVAFCLYYGAIASYLIVLSLNGTIARMVPTYEVAPLLHFDSIKPRDATSFVITGNIDLTEEGPIYAWDWVSNEFTLLSDAMNSHDAQWSTRLDSPSFWSPTLDGFGFARIGAFTGEVLEEYMLNEITMDINHIQLIENNTMAILSSRLTNSIVKYDIVKREAAWVCGGPHGGFDLYDKEGQKYPPGASLWFGQHNAEYYGNDLYFMFDNMYGANETKPSRGLVVEIDADRRVAREVWEYRFAKLPSGYSPMFGDNDRLPSGNMLMSWWPQILTSNETADIDAFIVELTPEKEFAWHLRVRGHGCAEFPCLRSSFLGWKTYAVERFYTAPLVYDVSCAPSVTFVTQNSIKQNDAYPGFYELRADTTTAPLASGHFDWKPHWAPTLVVSSFRGIHLSSVVISVTNQFGQSTTVTATCDHFNADFAPPAAAAAAAAESGGGGGDGNKSDNDS
ncbi:hypothetical protein CTAYLR_007150 [Chrysophaeum taylorii]|uniref:Uncharacterized protein n=1 Tax=Chrysophaeum taylorii TaxID=2483200 RepID=A0AAD7XQ98_9STRA|nr:hypothetical protein CTAYLR_007150 [Chrysophaeum taylorii]